MDPTLRASHVMGRAPGWPQSQSLTWGQRGPPHSPMQAAVTRVLVLVCKALMVHHSPETTSVHPSVKLLGDTGGTGFAQDWWVAASSFEAQAAGPTTCVPALAHFYMASLGEGQGRPKSLRSHRASGSQRP